MEQALKFDQGKAPLSLLPREALEQIAQVMAFGAAKYGRDNWRKGHEFTRLSDALLRHVYAWLGGETNDPESRMNHLAHAGCCVLFLLWGQEHRPEMDDRSAPPGPTLGPPPEAMAKLEAESLLARVRESARLATTGFPPMSMADVQRAFGLMLQNAEATRSAVLDKVIRASLSQKEFEDALAENEAFDRLQKNGTDVGHVLDDYTRTMAVTL